MTDTNTNQTTSQTRPLAARLAAAVANLGAVAKDRQSSAGGGTYRYRSIEAITAACRSALAAEGLALVPCGVELIGSGEYQTQRGGTMRWVRQLHSWELVCDGDSIPVAAIGEGHDTGDKSPLKAATAALKVALTHLLLISDSADDPDSVASPSHGAGGGSARSAPAATTDGGGAAADDDDDASAADEVKSIAEWVGTWGGSIQREAWLTTAREVYGKTKSGGRLAAVREAANTSRACTTAAIAEARSKISKTLDNNAADRFAEEAAELDTAKDIRALMRGYIGAGK